MKISKKGKAHWVLMLLLAITVLLSSNSMFAFHKEHKQPGYSLKKESKEQSSKKESLSLSVNMEAIVAPMLHVDFNKDVQFHPLSFSFFEQTISIRTYTPVHSAKYFQTLFTHIISPNAP